MQYDWHLFSKPHFLIFGGKRFKIMEVPRLSAKTITKLAKCISNIQRELSMAVVRQEKLHSPQTKHE